MSAQSTKSPPRHFSKQFKADAVQLVAACNTPKQVAERLDIDAHLLRAWVRQAAQAPPTGGITLTGSRSRNNSTIK